MQQSEDDFLETLARHGWHGTPWEDRTPERRESDARTGWRLILVSWLVGSTMVGSAISGFWGLWTWAYRLFH